ncbi:MAG: cold shock domain-containing protein [Patescibacteria group bacterium]
MTGSVKTMNEKGFGFITPDDGGKDLFFHQTGLVGVNFDELKSGDKVSFDTEESEKGPRATNVQRA